MTRRNKRSSKRILKLRQRCSQPIKTATGSHVQGSDTKYPRKLPKYDVTDLKVFGSFINNDHEVLLKTQERALRRATRRDK